MELARVIGTVVADRKHPSLVGVRLLVLQGIEAGGKNVGEPFVAADPLQAGPGDVVSWIGGREAALALPVTFTPVDAAIVTIVDDHWQDGKYL
jgi:ethanolamine utilization protein EutN